MASIPSPSGSSRAFALTCDPADLLASTFVVGLVEGVETPLPLRFLQGGAVAPSSAAHRLRGS